MWIKQHSQIYSKISPTAIWQAWADVDHWPAWDTELVSCQLEADFVAGSQFILKPKNGPKVKITLLEVTPERTFTDACRFLAPTLYDIHQLEVLANGLRITHTIKVTGPLAWVWGRLVANNIALGLPKQTANLVHYARQHYES